MAERNAIKDRKCKVCGTVVRGKAYSLKAHGKDCDTILREAASAALMEKIQKDLIEGEKQELTVSMADPKVIDAEGD